MNQFYRHYYMYSGPDKKTFLSGIMSTRKFVIVFVASIIAINLLTACEDTFDKPQNAAEFGIVREDVAKYRVSIKAPDSSAISVVRKVAATGEELPIATNKAGTFYDESPVSGETYIYIVGATTNDGEFIKGYSQTVRIPLDIISSNTQEVPAHFLQQVAREDGQFEGVVET